MDAEFATPAVPALLPTRRAGRQRVLMTADTVGGVWQYALELCTALVARGHEVVLATMGAMPNRDQRREAAEIPDLALHSSSYKLLWMDDPWNDLRGAGEWLMGLAAREHPTVVHLNDFGHGAFPWPAPVLLVGHSCVLSWWQAVHGVPAPPSWQRYRRCVRNALQAANLVVAPTHAMLHALRTHYGALPEGRNRFTHFLPSMNRLACRSWRPRWLAVRWCSATSTACARTGRVPRCSSRRLTMPRLHGRCRA